MKKIVSIASVLLLLLTVAVCTATSETNRTASLQNQKLNRKS